jgi:hypothetical protein
MKATLVSTAPKSAFKGIQEYIPNLAKHRGLNSQLALSVLEEVSRIVVPVDKSLYESHEELVHERIAH